MGNNKNGNIEMLATPTEISKMIEYARKPSDLPKIDLQDPAQVSARVNEYFDFCQQNGIRPGVVALGNWLGVHRSTLMRWRRGETRTEEHCNIVENAIGIIDSLWEMYMLEGKINTVGGIFLGKALLGYRETQEIVVTPNQPLGEQLNPAEVASRYVESLPENDA